MTFSHLPGELFIGRQQALSELARRAAEVRSGPSSLLLEGPRGIGRSELLRQLYTLLFWKQDAVVPFLYTVSPARMLVQDMARDYLVRFLCQWLAFEHKEQTLVPGDGVGLEELHSRAVARNADWAAQLLDRFRSGTVSPIDLLSTALHAPHAAARAAGKTVVVLIDDFHLFAGLRRDALPEPHLVALFGDLVASPRTPHFVAGLTPTIDELQLPVVERYPVDPLDHSDAELLIRSLLRMRRIVPPPVPRDLLVRLGGNPLYLRSIAAAFVPDSAVPGRAFWEAYRREVEQGMIARTLLAALRTAFPAVRDRRIALETLYAVTCSDRTPGRAWNDCSLPALVPLLTPEVLAALVKAGLVRGEFGMVLPIADDVFRDVVTALYTRHLAANSPNLPSGGSANAHHRKAAASFTVDLQLPHEPEAELIAAQCLEQIGKNRDIPPDVVGQLQIALIEACVNVLEHGQVGQPVPVCFEVTENAIEVVVFSSGRDFVIEDTGEPAEDQYPGAELRRGWGVTLMKRFCDTVRFEPRAHGSAVILRKQWSSAGKAGSKESSTYEHLRPFPET